MHGEQLIDKYPARVLGCLRSGFLTVDIWPGQGLADGGIRTELPIHIVPFYLRMPNSRFTLLYDREVEAFVGVEQEPTPHSPTD